MRQFASFLVALSLLTAVGCTADVSTTEDSTRMEAEMPKVEIGSEDVDLDPRTDKDVDVDTPLKGDS